MFHSEGLLSSGKSPLTHDAFTIRVADDFSPTPFGRYRSDGPESGEVFREDVLIPALNEHDRVVINVDGVAGLPSSFWEEALGGLVRAGHSPERIRQNLDIVTTERDLQTYVRLAWRYVAEADKMARKNA